MKVGDRILVDDGLIELVTLEVSGTRVHCRVLHGGRIKSHKGMNLPGVAVSAPSITEKDWADVAFAVEHELEYLALSFVRRAADIAELRTKIPKEMLVVAKIEKDSALDNIESIIHASDAVMVARGDLGVELPFEEVPIAQKRIISLCQPARPPGDHGDADARVDDHQSAPDARRGERRGQRDPRRHRRGDALRRDGGGTVPAARRGGDGAHHPGDREAARASCAPTSAPAPATALPTEMAIAAAATSAVRSLGAPCLIVFTKSGFSARIVASHRPGRADPRAHRLRSAPTDSSRSCGE